jgi:methyl-accepting chemotaxis protein
MTLNVEDIKQNIHELEQKANGIERMISQSEQAANEALDGMRRIASQFNQAIEAMAVLKSDNHIIQSAIKELRHAAQRLEV